MAFRPHKFGRYIIVDPIAVGGMAEIYRARIAASKEGPDRILVIKKVIANLSQNAEFLQMFEEEIKITVGLTHPNIIQIYDYGKNDGQYFMAMEYVEGKNLRQFVKRLADMKSMFSIDMSCYIISQVCHALGYAHAFKDRMSGKPLGIVHRDISPQNVMISYDGAVKLFDFGIAKAKSASEATRAGVIKGKPSYLSPEQINGEELDGRSDIFALGIVLWELLTAKRLFVAETDMGVLRLIQSAKIEPPSTFNPAVPATLDAIVLKSLTRDKNKRYQSAEEFQRELHKFLYSFNASFNPADLSYYAQELFKNEIKEDRERLHKFLALEPVEDPMAPEKPGKGPKTPVKMADGLISTTDFNREMMDMVAQQQTGSIKRDPSLLVRPGTPPGTRGSVSQNTMTRSPKGGTPPPRPVNPNEPMVIPPWSKSGGGSTGTPRSGSPRPSVTFQNQLANSIETERTSRGNTVLALLAVFVVGLVFVGRQYGMLCNTPLSMLGDCSVGARTAQVPSPAEEPPVTTAAAPVTAPPPSVAAPEPSRVPATPEAVILIKTRLEGYKVTVNGREMALNNGQFHAPLKEALRVEVSKVGFQTQRFVIPPLDRAGTYGYDVPAVELAMGSVNYNTIPPSRVTFWLGTEKIFEGETPVKTNLPVGAYRLQMQNSLLGIKAEDSLVVQEGKVTRAEKSLEMKK